jgi:hypothetical protein
MKKFYRLEVEVSLDEANEQKAIQVARNHYQAIGGTQECRDDDGDELREVPAEEFIAEPIDAIMMLLHGDPLCAQAGIEVGCLTCSESELGEPCMKTESIGPVTRGARRAKCTGRSAAGQGVRRNRRNVEQNQSRNTWFPANILFPS